MLICNFWKIALHCRNHNFGVRCVSVLSSDLRLRPVIGLHRVVKAWWCPQSALFRVIVSKNTLGFAVHFSLIWLFNLVVPVPVAGRSKAWVCGRSSAEIWVRIPPGGMDICLLYCVLSARGFYDELITRPEESCGLCCVVVGDLETSWMRRPWPTGGCRAKNKQISYCKY
jgi:hypothetical protein